jgi:formyltetrahydrofolate deformylase
MKVMTTKDKKTPQNTAILLMHCPDRPGIVAHITRFLSDWGGNILYLDQHVDQEQGIFFMRLEWDLDTFTISPRDLESHIETMAEKFKMTWRFYTTGGRPRMAIFVSKLSHCLDDILARFQSGEWNVEIPVVISNHVALEENVRKFGLEFQWVPKTKENREEQEKQELEILREHEVNFIVLARYMQVLSPLFVGQYRNKIINIHHSFLPAFPGGKPYHQAFERGVKIIGATSHYVTDDLDEGPIIHQDVSRVTHRDSVEDMVRIGRDLEKIVLARAIHAHLNRKLIVYKNKTVVFS